MDKKSILKFLIAVSFIAALYSIINPSEVIRNLGKADIRLYSLASFLFITTYVVAALRWKSLTESVGGNLSLNQSFRLISIAYSFNILFPGNSGDLARSKISERYEDIESHGSIIGIVALERFLDMISVLFVIGFALLFVASSFFSQIIWLFLPFLLLVLILSVLLIVKDSYMMNIFSYMPERVESFSNEVLRGYQSLSRDKIAFNMFCSIYIWVMEAIVFYILIMSLSFETGFWEGTIVTSSMSLVSSLPISPGGVGPVDATGTGLLVLTGLEKSGAFSLVLLQRSISLVLMAILGGSVYLFEEFRNHLA